MNELLLLFCTVAVTDFIAEMGDKTQLMLIGLTSKYKIRDIIIGTLVAVLILNGIAVLAGGLLNEFIPGWLIKFIAAAAFLYFSATSLSADDDEEEDEGNCKFKFAPAAVFCTFFVAELGDKTQLTAITFGANNGLRYALVIWLACSVGLFAADIIGMLVGLFLKKKAPEWMMSLLAFVLFGAFGFITLYEAVGLFNSAMVLKESGFTLPSAVVLAIAGLVFAVCCALILWFARASKAKAASEKE